MHLVVAFLVILCALIFSWSATGLRVMNVVATLQVIIGLALAGTFGANHLPLPPTIWVHIVCAVAAFAAYGMASAFGKRPGGRTRGTIFAVFGVLFVIATIAVGFHMAYPAWPGA